MNLGFALLICLNICGVPNFLHFGQDISQACAWQIKYSQAVSKHGVEKNCGETLRDLLSHHIVASVLTILFILSHYEKNMGHARSLMMTTSISMVTLGQWNAFLYLQIEGCFHETMNLSKKLLWEERKELYQLIWWTSEWVLEL